MLKDEQNLLDLRLVLLDSILSYMTLCEISRMKNFIKNKKIFKISLRR